MLLYPLNTSNQHQIVSVLLHCQCIKKIILVTISSHKLPKNSEYLKCKIGSKKKKRKKIIYFSVLKFKEI